MILGSLFALLALAYPGDPCRSGPAPGQRPAPYSSVISTGAERGRSHCYICETEDRPAVVIFARTLTEPLGKLAQRLDKAVLDHKKAQLKSWITLLSDDQTGLDPKAVAWSRKIALSNVPIGIFEDTSGPPNYRLAREADVTVVLFTKRKTVATFAYRAGEFDLAQVDRVMKALPGILLK
jgi:hypothetical protein